VNINNQSKLLYDTKIHFGIIWGLECSLLIRGTGVSISAPLGVQNVT